MRHPDVHEDDVGPVAPASSTASAPLAASPTTSMSGAESTSTLNPAADQRLVVGQRRDVT